MSIKGKDTELKHFTTFLIFEINLKWNLTEIRVIIIFFLKEDMFLILNLKWSIAYQDFSKSL